ncbi:hypothetical protein CASFOL_030208 [Castilleja foliolosa]|uniref:Uncharacterized protein n=1 Tax=Castilleja foliolosa TaxID=1961234 RepID=A0ABD3CBC4_9LAMI
MWLAAQQGILYNGEVDKITKIFGYHICQNYSETFIAENINISRDISGEGIHQALLNMLEGILMALVDADDHFKSKTFCWSMYNQVIVEIRLKLKAATPFFHFVLVFFYPERAQMMWSCHLRAQVVEEARKRVAGVDPI